MGVHITPSKSDNWGTPLREFQEWDNEFHFTLDPCADPRRPLKGGLRCFYKENDGLSKSWLNHSVFCNPPYTRGQIKFWVEKCSKEQNRAKVIVLLIPNQTDRNWFHERIWNKKRPRPGISIRFLKRLRFYDIDRDKPGGSSKNATMLIIFRRR